MYTTKSPHYGGIYWRYVLEPSVGSCCRHYHCSLRHVFPEHCFNVACSAYPLFSAAGSILTTEARHQAWISVAVDKDNPWSSPYDTRLAFGGVHSLVTPFT